ncbi:hypothetical protein CDD80_4586 [Ophiocordyceps camponoti-rufipedis]|uniref:Uncharacterized protein n=1 Tax=Ophiocordyceps camponoti-rufipedis TaxID=2004952 RepID=A0A2C5YZL4_9HYPO|nr:hypothetical protein CDD80_4586 [Ophiocordyceps camponoti-rufipedis]
MKALTILVLACTLAARATPEAQLFRRRRFSPGGPHYRNPSSSTNQGPKLLKPTFPPADGKPAMEASSSGYKRFPQRVLEGAEEGGFVIILHNHEPAMVDFDASDSRLEPLVVASNVIHFHGLLTGKGYMVIRLLMAAAACQYDGFPGPDSAFSRWISWLSHGNSGSTAPLSRLPGKFSFWTQEDELTTFVGASSRVGPGTYDESIDRILRALTWKWGERTIACLQLLMYRQGSFDAAFQPVDDGAGPAKRPGLHLPPYFVCPLCPDGNGVRVLCDLVDRKDSEEDEQQLFSMEPTKMAFDQRACPEYWDSRRQQCVAMARDLMELRAHACFHDDVQIPCGGGLSARRYLAAKARCRPSNARSWSEASAECRDLGIWDRAMKRMFG